MVLLIFGIFSKMLALNVIKFKDGIITIKDRTVVLMPVEILIYLHESISKVSSKEEADNVLFEIGKYQTMTGAPKYFQQRKELRRLFSRPPEHGDPSIEMGRKVLKFAGWGNTRVEEIRGSAGRIILKTTNSPIANEYLKTRGKSKKPVCCYLRGLLEGVVESTYKAKYTSKETCCRATGMSKECIFEFKKLSPRK